MSTTNTIRNASEVWADSSGNSRAVCDKHASHDAIDAQFGSFGVWREDAALVGKSWQDCEVCKAIAAR